MTTLIASPAAPRSRTSIFFSYIRHELWRNLRMVDSLIFLIALPLVIFAVFGVASPGTDKHIPGGTLAAYVMVSLALYGAATAATSMAGAAAVEHDSGWGRHLALTGMRRGDYLAGKIIVSLLIACLPIGATFFLGILTTAQFDTPGSGSRAPVCAWWASSPSLSSASPLLWRSAAKPRCPLPPVWWCSSLSSVISSCR